MKVEIGSRIQSRDGQDVGVVKHLIVDPADNHVRAVVLEQGFILTQDSVVPIEELSLSADNAVQLNRLAGEVKDLPEFHPSDYETPEPRGVDSYSADGDESGRYGDPVGGMLWPVVNPYPGSITGQGGFGAFPLFAPVGDFQQPVPVASVDREEMPVTEPDRSEQGGESESRPTSISRGSDVYAMNGDKIGEVKDAEFDAMSGRPMNVTITRGVLFTSTVSLPADKIATVDDGAVYLNIEEDELETWSSAPSVPYV